jgi:hypothetical protein
MSAVREQLAVAAFFVRFELKSGRASSLSSAMVLFASGVQLVAARPKDFHTISLQ